MPTVCVRCGPGPSSFFAQATPDAAAAIQVLTFTDWDGRVRHWEQSVYDAYTNAILVLHRDASRMSGTSERHQPNVHWSAVPSLSRMPACLPRLSCTKACLTTPG